ncbi:MAG TPA: signal peptidase II [Gemmatimonadaceae bacterium]|nr:signal peptidase II [Gemmatimonadaceae bacterium]
MTTRRALRFWPLGLIVLLADCATKRLAEKHLAPGIPEQVAGDVIQLTLTYNTGAVFGIPLGSVARVVLILVALGVLAVLLNLYRRTEPHDWWRTVSLALLCAGAVGNLLDRVRSPRGVVDFIDIGLGALRFWTFNVADMAVTVGAVMLAISLWREEKEHAARGARA